MNVRSYILLSLLSLITITICNAHDHHMVVVITSYNNQQLYLKNLQSLFSQDYKNFHVIYVDDCSHDGTSELVEQFMHDNKLQDKMLLIKNPVRCGALRNIYMAIHRYCNDDDIVAIYDGDDRLATDQALSLVNKAYQNPNIWTTYGNFSSTLHGFAEWCRPFENHVVKNRSYRKSSWRFGPLRTFYAWIFKQIELKDLFHEGKFYQMAWDQSFVHPILEMADGRFKFIPQVLYIYNEHNPINDWVVNGKLQHYLRDIILAKKPYKPLIHKPNLPTTQPSVCIVYVSHDNAEQARSILNNQEIAVSENTFMLWSCFSAQEQTAYNQLMQEYPDCTFVYADKNLKNLSNNQKFLEHNACLFIPGSWQPSQKLDISSYAQVLESTKIFIAPLITYKKTNQEPQTIRHSAYLWNDMFTFQLGWKPQLPYPYKEHAWLMQTKKCVKYSHYIHNLLHEHSAHHKVTQKLTQKAGLLIITK